MTPETQQLDRPEPTAVDAGTRGASQRTEGEGQSETHTHPAVTHEHDHYHVSHHYRRGAFVDWEHRTFWHTHEHNHAELTHSHDYELEPELAHHANEAHIHDHTAPAHSHR